MARSVALRVKQEGAAMLVPVLVAEDQRKQQQHLQQQHDTQRREKQHIIQFQIRRPQRPV